MTPREVSKELRKVQENHKGMFVPTFQINIHNMARDAADAIDSLQAFTDLIHSLSNCNKCEVMNCSFKPSLGETVRYNCPFFEGKMV